MSDIRKHDILIIGAGAVGCALARQLSRYSADICVAEKNSDVAGETTGRNSAVVHCGFNNRPGSLMAKFCVQGNRGFEKVCEQLDVPYRKTGKLVIASCQEDMDTVRRLYEQGTANGCTGLEIISGEEVRKLIPNISPAGALYSKDTAVTSPFLYCVALAENAHANGVDFVFDAPVSEISFSDGMYHVTAGDYHIDAHTVINCAGLGAPEVAEAADAGNYRIYPCRGEYYITDVDREEILPMPVYPVPGSGGGLGVHLTPTVEGNIIIGPSAEYIESTDDYGTSSQVMNKLLREAEELMPEIGELKKIGSYSGIRPKLTSPEEGGYKDFVISEDRPGFINLVGIESPGLTASLPMADYVAEYIAQKCGFKLNESWNPVRKGITRFRDLSEDEQDMLIKKNPEYGQILCRCRWVSLAEIRAAIENPLGVRTISGIKYRAWATTGRCNGGYCLPHIVRLLTDEYGMKPEDICYRNEGSSMFRGKVK